MPCSPGAGSLLSFPATREAPLPGLCNSLSCGTGAAPFLDGHSGDRAQLEPRRPAAHGRHDRKYDVDVDVFYYMLSRAVISYILIASFDACWLSYLSAR